MGVEVLRTRLRLGGGSALCRCWATDAITCLRKNAVLFESDLLGTAARLRTSLHLYP